MAEIRAFTTRDALAPRRTHRFAIIDALRFLAAFGVMGFHFTSRLETSWGRPVQQEFPFLHRITAYGALGVELFFAISGFVILMSAWDRTLPQFVASRASRLYPAYWFGVLLTATVLWFGQPGHGGLTQSKVLINLTMMQSAFGAGDVDGAYWTLYAELRFYLLIGLLVLIGLTARRVMAFCALWPPLAYIAHITGFHLGSHLLVADQAGLFAGGMMVYVLYREGDSLLAWLILGEDIVMGSYTTVVGLMEPSTSKDVAAHLSATVYYLAIFAFFAALLVVTRTRLRSVEWRWLTTLGLLTYPVYLLHEHIGWWLISVLAPHLDRYAVLLLTVAIIVALAWLVQRFVERPLGPRMRRALERSLPAGSPGESRTASIGPADPGRDRHAVRNGR